VTAQRVAPRLNLLVSPPSSGILGQPLTLGVRPVVPGTTYRYLARMILTGTAMIADNTYASDTEPTRSHAGNDYRHAGIA
jgi:hypothetical protein